MKIPRFVFGVFFVMLFSTACGVKRIPSFAGPYRAIMRRCSNISDEYKSSGDFWAQLRIVTPRSGKVPFGWGRSVNRIPIDDKIRILIMIHVWNNNEWKKNAFRMNFAHACSDALQHAPSILTIFYGKDGHKCPVPPGERIIPNKSLEMVFPTFPVFPYGRWLFVLIGFLGDRVAGIHTFEADTVPKM